MNVQNCNNVTAINTVTGNTVYISDDDAMKIQRIKEKTVADIDNWTKGMVETQAVRVIVDKLKSGQRLITITGHPGEGKTTLGYMVLKEMRRLGHEVFVVVNQSDFFHISVKVPKAIFMLDDVLGTFMFDRESYRKWESVICELVKMDEHQTSHHGMFDSKYGARNCAVLVGRYNTFQEAKDHFGRYKEHIFGESRVVDISHDVVLTDEDKEKILRYHSENAGIHVSEAEWENLPNITSTHGFPHCCRIYTNIKKKDQRLDLLSFFSNPQDFLDHTTTMYLTQPSFKNMFLLLLKSDGRIDTDSEEDDVKREELKSVEMQLVDSYLKREDGMVCFSHPSVYESVAFAVGKKDPVFVIKHCSLEFIIQRVRFGSSKKSSDLRGFLCINMTKGNRTQMIKRFAKELAKKHFFVLHHQVFRDGELCEQILDTALTSQQRSVCGHSQSVSIME